MQGSWLNRKDIALTRLFAPFYIEVVYGNSHRIVYRSNDTVPAGALTSLGWLERESECAAGNSCGGRTDQADQRGLFRDAAGMRENVHFMHFVHSVHNEQSVQFRVYF
ncbi:hypothetical protein BH10ACI2_BH10ACI2_08980 [soil metagenome]